jgi:hypothetical protein
MDYSYQGRHPPPQLAAMAAQTNATLDEQEWLADSGANAHITNELSNLTIQQPFENNEIVAVGNGSALTIDNFGSALIHSSNSDFKLHNVLHCPNASTNLLSIQRFCVDNDCFFVLTDSHFFVKDTHTKAILLAGKSENGLYPLRFQRGSIKARRATVALLGIRTSSLIWHFRLGHPSTDIVSRVVNAFHLTVSHSNAHSNKIAICDSCQLGKSKRLPFSASNRQTTTPLKLIHTDIWTSPVLSVRGYKYYVVFVDDFSRYTWFYPLHDVYECFIKFKVLAEKQFSTPIKQLQSDGGGEFISNHFQSFLTKHGIVHQKSCPYTSQQNGLAERKLRHILEIGLTLLAHSHLSNRYWVDSFLTAVYLINRLPSSVLGNISPYSKLHQKDPDYQQLKVFGCKCYPLLRPLGTHKLEFRSKPCIFLEYCYAGYKCLDPISNKVYLSRHVVFDEHSFPAKDQVSSHLPSKISAIGDVPFTLPVSTFTPSTNQLPVSGFPSTSSPTSPNVFPSPSLDTAMSEPTTEIASDPTAPQLNTPTSSSEPPPNTDPTPLESSVSSFLEPICCPSHDHQILYKFPSS